MDNTGYSSGGRCMAVIHWHNGGVNRCSAQCTYDSDEFCYHHKKYFDNLSSPAPGDMWEPKANGRCGNDEYIEKVTSLDGKQVRTYR